LEAKEAALEAALEASMSRAVGSLSLRCFPAAVLVEEGQNAEHEIKEHDERAIELM
jgi:hypothetical protein